MKRTSFLFFLLAFSVILSAQQTSIRGFVYEKGSGEPVMFANVFLKGTPHGVATDINGYYNLTKLKGGTYTLMIRSMGYDSLNVTITVKDGELLTKNFHLSKSSVILKDVEISAEKQARTEQIRTSIVKVTPKQIQQLPSVGGEPDFAQYLQVVPGVIFTGDQGGQLYIRGGSPIQNKVLLDGMVIYNPFHSIGFFSVFDSDIMRNADVYTGGFNSQYGGRISSVMDITMRDGNKNKQHGKFSLTTFGSKLMLEGPLKKASADNNSTISYIFSGKRSYLSESSKLLYSYVDTLGLPFDFTDLYGKVTLNSENGTKINLFGFRFYDRVKYKILSDLNWTSYGLGSNVILVPAGSSALIRFNISYSRYDINLNEVNAPPRSSMIDGFNFGSSFLYFFGKNELDYGIEVLGSQTNFNFYNAVGRYIFQEQNTTELALYCKYKMTFGKLLIDPGMRIQYYASLSKFSPEPRLGVKYNMLSWMRLKFSGGLYSQNLISANSDRDVVNLFYGFLSGPELGDIPASFDGKETTHSLQKSWHTIGGVEFDVTNNIEINVEGYFKKNTQLLQMNRNKLFDDNGDNYQKPEMYKLDFVIETGDAYGADVTIKYEYKRNYLWLVYALGYVNRFDGFDQYHPHYDRRHNVNVVASRTFGKNLNWELGLRWNYGSGFPFTPSGGYYEKLPLPSVNTDINGINGDMQIIYGQLNSHRLSDYHRMDMTLKYHIDLNKNQTFEALFSVTNVYNRENIFYVERTSLNKVYQLPVIPSIGLTYSF
jgi:hypothetical protein